MNNDMKIFRAFLSGFGVVIVLFIFFSFLVDKASAALLDYSLTSSTTVLMVEDSVVVPAEPNELFSKRTPTEQYYSVGNHNEQKIYAIPRFSPLDLSKSIIISTSTYLDFDKKYPVKPAGTIDIISRYLGISSVSASSSIVNQINSGSIYKNAQPTFSGAHDATSGTVDLTVSYVGNEYSGSNYNVWRGMFNFIGTTTVSEIASATLNFYVFSTNYYDTQNDNVYITGSNHSNPLTANDFNDTTNVLYSAAKDLTSLVVSSYNSIDLNATGTSAIGPTSTKMALKVGQDINNTTPTGRNLFIGTGAYLYIIYRAVACPELPVSTSTLLCEYQDSLDNDTIGAYLDFWWKWPFILFIIMGAFYFLRWFARKITTPSI